MLAYLRTNETLEVIFNGVPYSIHFTHSLFDDVTNAIRVNDKVALKALLDRLGAIRDNVAEVVVENGQVFFGDEALHGTMIDRLLAAVGAGDDYQPILEFVKKLMKNPSLTSIGELYDFLEIGKMPITEDGHFLAYKVVRGDYKDVHSGTMDNSVGNIVSMPRPKVDPDRNNLCSSGLHFCSFDYVQQFWSTGFRLLIVKVDPADVVSIPPDHNSTKARACKYEVLMDVTEQLDDVKVNPELLDDASIADDIDWYGEESEAEDDDINDEEIVKIKEISQIRLPKDAVKRGFINKKDGRYQRYHSKSKKKNFYQKVSV